MRRIISTVLYLKDTDFICTVIMSVSILVQGHFIILQKQSTQSRSSIPFSYEVKKHNKEAM